jgi:hypothetical protein
LKPSGLALGDMAPALLDASTRARLQEAKERAAERSARRDCCPTGCFSSKDGRRLCSRPKKSASSRTFGAESPRQWRRQLASPRWTWSLSPTSGSELEVDCTDAGSVLERYRRLRTPDPHPSSRAKAWHAFSRKVKHDCDGIAVRVDGRKCVDASLRIREPVFNKAARRIARLRTNKTQSLDQRKGTIQWLSQEDQRMDSFDDAPLKRLEQFIVLQFHGVGTNPDNTGVELLLQDQRHPEHVLPLVLFRPAAQRLRDLLNVWLDEPTHPRGVGSSNPLH